MSKRKSEGESKDEPVAKRPRPDPVYTYACTFPDCDYTDHDHAIVRRHMTKHTTARPFKCRRCDKKFKTLYTARGHEKTVHVRAKTYACAQCSKVYTVYNSWRYHMRTKHPALPDAAEPTTGQEELGPDAAPT